MGDYPYYHPQTGFDPAMMLYDYQQPQFMIKQEEDANHHHHYYNNTSSDYIPQEAGSNVNPASHHHPTPHPIPPLQSSSSSLLLPIHQSRASSSSSSSSSASASSSYSTSHKRPGTAASGHAAQTNLISSSSSSSMVNINNGLRKSCQHCRKRKIRCIPTQDDPATCKACANKSQPCIFEKQSTMGRPPKNKLPMQSTPQQQQQQQQQQQHQHQHQHCDDDDDTAGADNDDAHNNGEQQAIQNSTSQPKRNRRNQIPPPFSAVTEDDFYYPNSSSNLQSSNKRPRIGELAAVGGEDYHNLPPFGTINAASIDSLINNSSARIPGVEVAADMGRSIYDNPDKFNSLHTGDPHYFLSNHNHTLHRNLHLPQIDPQLTALPSLSSATSSSTSTSFSSNIPTTQTPSHGHSPSTKPLQDKDSLQSASITNVASLPAVPTSNPNSALDDIGQLDLTLPIHTQENPFDSFRQSPLHDIVSAFHSLFTASGSSSPNPLIPSLSDPRIPPIARSRVLCAKAISNRVPLDRGDSPATPNYARSLVSPLWDGLPVDLIALSTTGKPSASGPFSIVSEVSKKGGRSVMPEEYLYVKLLREDESTPFKHPSSENVTPRPASRKDGSERMGHFSKKSPGFRYAPEKTTVAKYFTGYFNKHPLAPLIINERLFLDDLMMNKVDDVLAHVIIGSAIARAPCLGAGDVDAEDIGAEFFEYVEQQLLPKQLEGSQSIQTCQALMLWGTHELAHMRPRRFAALWATADVILRRRLQAFQTRLDTEADFGKARMEGRISEYAEPPPPLGWRDLVEQELTVNALWVMVTWNAWTSLSLKLPHNTMSVMAASVPLPPQNVQVSSSFAYAYGGPKCTSPSQPTVRRVIERFSEVAQLINVIISIKSQSQARNIFAPDPPRPLAVLDDEDARIAGWLVDLAQFYEKSGSQSNALGLGDLPSAESNGAVTISDSSRAFMVVSHAILALHQVLPYAPNSSTSFGSPMPLPTIESLRTALKALHVVSRSIQISAPNSRTRTQAVLLDAMPRILSLIDIFTNASLSSLDHFVMMTAQRDMVHELLGDLRRAVSSMGSHAMHARSLDSCCSTLEKASKGLRAVVDIGSQLQNQPSVQAHFAGYNTEQAPATNGISEETHTRSNAHALNHPGTFDHILNASFQASAHPHKPTVAPYSAPDDMSMASHLIHSPLSNRENGAGTMQPTSLHAYL